MEKYNIMGYIGDPQNENGKEYDFNFIGTFIKDKGDYGNGFYLSLKGTFDGAPWENYYDLRYNASFNENEKIDFIFKLLNNKWNGQNGAYIIKGLSGFKID